MSEPPGDRVQDLFDQAVGLPPGQRTAFLETACAADPALRAEVESLLACDKDFPTGDEEGLLKSPLVRSPGLATEVTDEPGPAAWAPGLPVRVGRYRVLRRIAEGGMGVVYEAEQDNPRRVVALKVIRPGRASPTLLKRFSQEAQILGRLHHPGIAQVYEAGLADDGQPFFAMELIRGLPLDEYARLRSLTLPARLELVARVCDAVQHAHDQGVIHRDLKPSNILVEETGQPKVLDFGVARATDAGLLSGAGLTQTGQLLGTPNYMSPEQMSANPAAIDGRADVYALGVILFELAAHRLPYRLENRPLVEATRLILEQDSPRLGSVDADLRGDVETIVAKALEKDLARRYPSAADLAADLRRWLAHEPILARPPSALYHLRKFARRHKALVGGVLAALAALVLGLIGTILYAVDARQNARRATEKEKEARYQTYRARVAAANAALTNHDVADAAQQLKDAPEELRDWEWHHLQSRLDDSVAVVPVEANEAVQLAGSPDGLRVAASARGRVRLLDLEGHELLTRSFQPDRTWALVDLVSSRRPKLVEGPRASGRGGKTIQVVDEEGRLLARLKDVPGIGGPGPECLSPDGSRLAVAWMSRVAPLEITLYELNTENLTPTRVHPGCITLGLAISADGKRFASAGVDGVARVWDSVTGKLICSCRGHRSKVLGVAFRPDGQRLVTTSADGSVRQWDPAKGRQVEPPYERHTGEVLAAAYSPDGRWVVSGGTDRTVRVWGATDREEVAILHGHTNFVQQVAFTPDGRRVVSASAFNRKGPTYVGDGTVRVWEALPGASLPVLRGHTNYVYAVACSPDGRWIASGSWAGSEEDGTVRLWDARTGEPCATLPHKGNVRALAFSPDSSWLVCASDGQDQLQVWDVATGQRRRDVPGPGKVVQAVTVSPDGARVAAMDPGGSVRITERTTSREIASWRVDGGRVTKKGLAYGPDGSRLAGTGEDDQTIDVWDGRTHKRTARLAGHTGPVYSVAFNPDGRRLVSASGDRTVRVWDIATAECVAVLKGHTDEVFAAVFHPDGRQVASAGRDRAVWLWDLATGQEVARLQGHTNYIISLAFSPDGKSLVSGSGDNTVRLWDTAPLKTRYQARREAAAR